MAKAIAIEREEMSFTVYSSHFLSLMQILFSLLRGVESMIAIEKAGRERVVRARIVDLGTSSQRTSNDSYFIQSKSKANSCIFFICPRATIFL